MNSVKRLLTVIVFLVLTTASSQVYLGATSIELGVQYEGVDWVPFAYASQPVHFTDFTIGQLWIIPSVEVAFDNPLAGWAQLELVADTSAFSISGRARVDSNGEWRARVGLLLTLDLFREQPP